MPSFVANPNEIKGFTPGSVASNQTIQGQMSGLLDSNNPLLKRAKTKAAQAANSRGLLNSSMGVQAGEEAVLTAALPIAQFDATQFSNQSKLNQDWQNKFGLEGNAYQYQTGLKEQDYQQQLGKGIYGGASGTGLIGAQTSAQSQLQAEKSAQALAAQKQSEAHQASLQSTELGFKGSESTAQRGHELGIQTSQQQFQAGESSLERGQKSVMQQADIASQRERLATEIESRERVAGRQITHEQALAEADRQLKSQLQTSQQTFQAGESLLTREQQAEQQRLDIEAKKDQLATEIASREGIAKDEILARMDLQGQQLLANEAEYLAKISSQEGISTKELANRLALSAADITSKEKLAGNQITHEAALAASKNALETELTVKRIASQEGISTNELANRLAVQANQIIADEAKYLAQISSTEGISAAELANRLALSTAEITSRETLAGNQITHEAALAHAKNSLEVALQAERIASQEGISEKELQNRLDVQAKSLAADEKKYLAQISSSEGISEKELANRLALNVADITSREKLAGNQITHEAALANAKNSLEVALQAERISAQTTLQTQAEAHQVGLQTQTEAHQVGLQTQAESFKASMADKDFYHKGQLISAEAKEKRITIAAELHQRLWNAQQLENLSAANKEKLAILDKDMKLAIQGSASASQILTQTMNAIGEVSAIKDLSQDNLDKRIASIISHANANIKLIQTWSTTEGGSFTEEDKRKWSSVITKSEVAEYVPLIRETKESVAPEGLLYEEPSLIYAPRIQQSFQTEDVEKPSRDLGDSVPYNPPQHDVPNWVIAPPPDSMSTGVMTELTNPATGETWMAPSGGYSVNPSLTAPQQFYDKSGSKLQNSFVDNILRHLVNIDPLEGDRLAAADLTGDGKVNISDGIAYQRRVLGLEDWDEGKDADYYDQFHRPVEKYVKNPNAGQKRGDEYIKYVK